MPKFLLILLAGFLVAADAPVSDATKKDLKALEGSWKVVGLEATGEKQPAESMGIDQVVITETRLTLRKGGEQVISFGLKIDSSTSPKAMDWRIDEANASLPVIYAIQGDELRMCFPLLPGPDNKEFEAGHCRMQYSVCQWPA